MNKTHLKREYKTHLKRECRTRHEVIKTLQKRNYLVEIIDRFGRSVILNTKKHFLYDRPYINEEYQKELVRREKIKKKEKNNGNE